MTKQASAPPARIELARRIDAGAVSSLLSTVLTSLPYYNRPAIRAELAKFSAHQLRKWIADDPHTVLVAKRRNEIVGFCINRTDDDLIWLEWFGVHPSHRRLGIGSALLTSLEHFARLRGAHKIWCDSRTDNLESLQILSRHAYHRLCTLKNHWHGQDFFLWEKPLS